MISVRSLIEGGLKGYVESVSIAWLPDKETYYISFIQDGNRISERHKLLSEQGLGAFLVTHAAEYAEDRTVAGIFVDATGIHVVRYTGSFGRGRTILNTYKEFPDDWR